MGIGRLSTLIFFCFFLTSVSVFANVIWEDSFENGFSGWLGHTNVFEVVNTQSRTGNHALLNRGAVNTAITHNVGNAYEIAYECSFYDFGDRISETLCSVSNKERPDSGSSLLIGIETAKSKEFYTYFLSPDVQSWGVTSVPRSKGWHTAVFYKNNGKTQLFLDTVRITETTKINNWEYVGVWLNGWNTHGHGFALYDDFRVSQGINNIESLLEKSAPGIFSGTNAHESIENVSKKQIDAGKNKSIDEFVKEPHDEQSKVQTGISNSKSHSVPFTLLSIFIITISIVFYVHSKENKGVNATRNRITQRIENKAHLTEQIQTTPLFEEIKNSPAYQVLRDVANKSLSNDDNDDDLIELAEALVLSGFEVDEDELIDLLLIEIDIQNNLKQLERLQKQEATLTFEKHKEKLIKSSEYLFIENYVKKQDGNAFTNSDVSQLNKLLKKNGHQFNAIQLQKILSDENKRQTYIKFKKKMSLRKSTDLENTIRHFLEVYAENYTRMIPLLEAYLNETQTGPSVDLETYIKTIKEDLELDHFERKLSDNDHKKYSMDNLDKLDGHEFEAFLEHLFVRMGYSVTRNKLSNDQGADLIIIKFGDKTVVQAKRHNAPITNDAVQEVIGAIGYYEADNGMVVTTSKLTKSAIELAESNKIKLIDRFELNELIKQYL